MPKLPLKVRWPVSVLWSRPVCWLSTLLIRSHLSPPPRGQSTRAIIVKSNHVGESIITTAKNEQCDLIVMASHGRSSFARLLMSSETLHVLRHLHIPVLVLR